ncbi:MAG: EAL domain-containing protein [Methylotenera sp.]|nr:EAL domain-containing protein [Methylotenera sp.]
MNKKIAIQSEQLQLLLSTSYKSLTTGVLLALVLAYTQRELHEPEIIIIWLFSVIAIALYRAVLAFTYQRTPVDGHSTAPKQLNRLRCSIIISGIAWGSAGWLLYPANDLQHLMFLMILLAGLSAGGVVSFSADIISAITYTVTVLIPIIICLLLAEDSLTNTIGLTGILYLGFMIMSAHYFNKKLTENIVLRLEANARENAMRLSEERYRLLLSHSPVGIFHYDTNLTVTYCNKHLASLLHISTDDIIGVDINALKDKSILPALRKALTGELGYYDGHYTATASDAEGWIDLVCAPIQNNAGKVEGGIAIIQDITARKLAEDKLKAITEQLRDTLDAIPDLLFELGLDGRYYAVHSPDETLLVAPAKELIGKTVPEVLPAKSAATIMSALQEAHEKGWSRGMQYQRKSPKGLLWFDLSVARKSSHDDQNPHFLVLSRDITERKQVEESLRNNELRWKFAVEGSGDGVWDWNIQTNEVQYSNRWKNMLGYADHDILPTNQEWVNRVHPEDSCYVAATMQAYLKGKSSIYVVEYRLRCKDDSYKWILGRGMVVSRDENGEPLRMIGTHTDITERKNTEQDLRISAIAFEAQESMMVSDANKIILRVNKAFSDITGYTAEEVVGRSSLPLRSSLHDESFYTTIWDNVNANGAWKGEIYSKRKNGEVFPGILSITAVKGLDNTVSNYVTSLVDITVEKITAEEIQFLAFYDSLTGLPNRRLLLERLRHALAASARNGRDGALLFIDLDHFKSLNDTLGHDIGDLLLQQVAKRLTACVREEDTVARLGGDEYVVLLENLSQHAIEAATQVEVIGTKILAALNQAYQLNKHEYHSTLSMGAALFSDHNQSQEDLLKHADIAMYQAKKAGRNTLRFFDPQMQEAIHARVDLERELRKALEKQQFQLYYQVQVNSAGNVIGAEGLIRWLHPERGLVSPLHFISLAEETGLILPIGEWVLDTACAQIKTWQHNTLTKNITLSVNVSAKQFQQADFSTQVEATVQRYGINPMKLKLELTESILLEDFDSTAATMSALENIGVQFSLDDFGTGYSSLQYLKRLPLHQLKIDQSFVRDILADNSDKAIVRTIIAIAQSLELDVIAEGVETEEQRQLLLQKGCHSFQGFLFGEAVPIEQFEAALTQA